MLLLGALDVVLHIELFAPLLSVLQDEAFDRIVVASHARDGRALGNHLGQGCAQLELCKRPRGRSKLINLESVDRCFHGCLVHELGDEDNVQVDFRLPTVSNLFAVKLRTNLPY